LTAFLFSVLKLAPDTPPDTINFMAMAGGIESGFILAAGTKKDLARKGIGEWEIDCNHFTLFDSDGCILSYKSYFPKIIFFIDKHHHWSVKFPFLADKG